MRELATEKYCHITFLGSVKFFKPCPLLSAAISIQTTS